jgi:hypothetical protein
VNRQQLSNQVDSLSWMAEAQFCKPLQLPMTKTGYNTFFSSKKESSQLCFSDKTRQFYSYSASFTRNAFCITDPKTTKRNVSSHVCLSYVFAVDRLASPSLPFSSASGSGKLGQAHVTLRPPSERSPRSVASL